MLGFEPLGQIPTDLAGTDDDDVHRRASRSAHDGDDVTDEHHDEEDEDRAAEHGVVPAFRMRRPPEPPHADDDRDHGNEADGDSDRSADRRRHADRRRDEGKEDVGEEAAHRRDEDRLLKSRLGLGGGCCRCAIDPEEPAHSVVGRGADPTRAEGFGRRHPVTLSESTTAVGNGARQVGNRGGRVGEPCRATRHPHCTCACTTN